jgi:hypothetical protein
MSLEEDRLDLAVKVTVRALRDRPEAPVTERLAAFRTVYEAVADLDTGDADWTAETLKAAWALVSDAWPRGGPVGAVVAGLAAAHAAIVRVADAPRPGVHRRR